MPGARVINVSEGEDLVEALRAARAGWLSAVGTVQAVELRMAGEGADPIRALRGRLTLVSLAGPGDGPWGVVLSRATDTGIEVVGGELVRATSAGVKLAAHDSVVSAPTLSAPPSPPSPPSPPTPAAPPATNDVAGAPRAASSQISNWAAAATASARALRAQAMDDDQPTPEPGDLVWHFAFGLCEVLMTDHDRLKIRDVEGPGRIREIRLDMLNVRGPTDKDGKRMFQLERRG